MQCTKCKQGLIEGQKFCGDCGTVAPEPMAKAECANGHEVLAKAKFCGECGESLLQAEDFAAGMDAVRVLAKAASGITDDFQVDPDDIDGEDGDDPDDPDKTKGADTGTPLAKAELELPEGFEAVNAEPLIKAFVQAHNRVNGGVRTLGRSVNAIRRDFGTLLAKAILPMMTKLQALEEQVGALGNTRQPRKAVITPLAKAVATGDPNLGADESPRGEPLLKAALDGQIKGVLQPTEVSIVESYANQGMSLAQIAATNPSLGARLGSLVGGAASPGH